MEGLLGLSKSCGARQVLYPVVITNLFHPYDEQFFVFWDIQIDCMQQDYKIVMRLSI